MDQDGWPLPQHPALARAAEALEARGFAGEVWDSHWRLVYLSSEYRTLISAGRRDAAVPGRGEHVLSQTMCEARDRWPTGPTFESFRESVRDWGGLVAATQPGGVEALLALADPRLRDVLEDAEVRPPPSAWSLRVDVKFGNQTIGNDVLLVALWQEDGERAGYLSLAKPELRAGVLGLLALGDARLFERMSSLLAPARRPAAILYADLEASTPLARRLSTPAYFSLIRRLVHATDRVIVDAAGIVGKHVGDGVTALFLVEDVGSESAAARAAIESMHAIRHHARAIAQRSSLEPADVTMRFGLHWGSTLYVGRLMTSGRAEVTALGDEMNEAARIEACATGGRALASKALLERLDPGDSDALGLDLERISYQPLTNLATASAKARRDAPALAVCELTSAPTAASP